MKPSLTPGVTGEARHRVVTENLVSHHNPRGPAVLSSPAMLLVMEHAAHIALAPHLDEGEDSVGVGFEFEHRAPTPAGAWLRATAKVTHVEGSKITLDFEAHDGHEVVGRGKHVRVVLDLARFRKRLDRKANR